jgi:DNA-binding LacI/PurR family transcriptional regulator
MSSPVTHVVTSDQVANMMLAFEQILRRGYERIGFITETAARKWILFEAGFLMAQQRLEHRNHIPLFRVAEHDPTTSQQALARWLKKEKPDAIITTVREARNMLQKAGCRVPDDAGLAAMSIVDGNADAGIYQNSEEIGRAAVLLLISMIQDNDRGIPLLHRELLVPGTWVDGSTLPLRANPALA